MLRSNCTKEFCLALYELFVSKTGQKCNCLQLVDFFATSLLITCVYTHVYCCSLLKTVRKTQTCDLSLHIEQMLLIYSLKLRGVYSKMGFCAQWYFIAFLKICSKRCSMAFNGYFSVEYSTITWKETSSYKVE